MACSSRHRHWFTVSRRNGAKMICGLGCAIFTSFTRNLPQLYRRFMTACGDWEYSAPVTNGWQQGGRIEAKPHSSVQALRPVAYFTRDSCRAALALRRHSFELNNKGELS